MDRKTAPPNFSETTFFYYKKLQKMSMNKSHFITEIVEYLQMIDGLRNIIQIKDTLESSTPPSSNNECKQCQYVQKKDIMKLSEKNT